MRCAKCGADNREGARFCDKCGAKLSPKCSSCGAENRSDAKFCYSCGAVLESDGGVSALSAVTVLRSPSTFPAEGSAARIGVSFPFLAGRIGRARLFSASREEFDPRKAALKKMISGTSQMPRTPIGSVGRGKF
jgi:ribosomal protein L40E